MSGHFWVVYNPFIWQKYLSRENKILDKTRNKMCSVLCDYTHLGMSKIWLEYCSCMMCRSRVDEISEMRIHLNPFLDGFCIIVFNFLLLGIYSRIVWSQIPHGSVNTYVSWNKKKHFYIEKYVISKCFALFFLNFQWHWFEVLLIYERLKLLCVTVLWRNLYSCSCCVRLIIICCLASRSPLL